MTPGLALSREASDVMAPHGPRKTDVRTETQPNGSEVTTTIVEFTNQVPPDRTATVWRRIYERILSTFLFIHKI